MTPLGLKVGVEGGRQRDISVVKKERVFVLGASEMRPICPFDAMHHRKVADESLIVKDCFCFVSIAVVYSSSILL